MDARLDRTGKQAYIRDMHCLHRAHRPRFRFLPVVRALSAALLVNIGLSAPLLAQTGPDEQFEDNRHWEYPRGAWADSVRRLDPYAFRFRHALFDVTERARRNRLRAASAAFEDPTSTEGPLAVEGTYRFPVLVGRFGSPDDIEPHPIADLQERLWSAGYTGGGHQGSVRDYYQEVSYGLLTLTGDTYGYAAADSAVDWYREAVGSDPGFGPRMIDWVDEVIDALDPTVDFSQYDGNDDGYVDTLVLVHNLAGFECSNLPPSQKGFWSHRWNYSSMSYWYRGTAVPRSTDDGVMIDDYVMQPMVGCDGSSLIAIGVFAHELGHAFGLPDYYDTDGLASGGESEGLGHWDLMASGNWNAPTSPAHMSAISKTALGWITPLEIASRDTLHLRLPRAEDHPVAVRVRSAVMGPGEYFLVENRQAVGFDKHLHGTGLVVYHVNESVATANRNPSDLRWAVEQADGRFDLERNVNRGDGGDPWAGLPGSRWFRGDGTPSSYSRSQRESYVELILRETSGDTMSADILSTPRFALLEPDEGAAVRQEAVLLRWERYEPPFFWDGIVYQVEVDSDPDFLEPRFIESTSAAAELTASLTEGMTHYWRVRARDAAGHTRFNPSGAATFIVDGTPPVLSLRPFVDAGSPDELSVLVRASEPLDTLRAEVEGSPLELASLPGEEGWVLTLPLEVEGDRILDMEAVDQVGNTSSCGHALTLRRLGPDRRGVVAAGSGRFQAVVPPEAVVTEGWGILFEDPWMEGPPEGDPLSGVFWLRLPRLVPGMGAEVRMTWSEGELPAGHSPVIWTRAEESWSPLLAGSDRRGRVAVVRTVSDGSFQLRSQASAGPIAPAATDLVPPWPNPFNPSTRIAFDLATEQSVRLEIYNSRGQRVRELAGGIYPAGRHVVTWDGKDAAGRQASSGVYLVLLKTERGSHSRKVTLIR